MDATEVLKILRAKRIDCLHHANSVQTSCTFLTVGGLASRGYVEKNKLAQTPQSSDAIDKKYKIWDDVFVDTVDIHARTKRSNFYGPVLFVLDVALLGALPKGSEVLVTKKNPTNWVTGESESERWFESTKELSAKLTKGTFGQIIVIRTPNGIVPFQTNAVTVVLDDPKRELSPGNAAVTSATKDLQKAAKAGGAKLTLTVRQCVTGCKCVANYKTSTSFQQHFK